MVYQADLGFLIFMLRLLSPLSRCRSFLTSGLLLLVSLLGPLGLAAQEQAEESVVKAAFIYRIAQYVGWPSGGGTDENLIICTLGEEKVHQALVSQVQGRVIDGRRVQAAHHTQPEGVENCHLLFVSETEESSLEEVLGRLSGISVLTISDIEGFAESGGMIGFLRKGDNLTFEINVDSAREVGVEIRGRLLAAASRVISDSKPRRRSTRGRPALSGGLDRDGRGGFE